MTQVKAKLEIEAYLHCKKCIEDLPQGASPREWLQIEAGFTTYGLQIWCKRHECNIIHIDFEGHQHPSNVSADDKPFLKVVN